MKTRQQTTNNKPPIKLNKKNIQDIPIKKILAVTKMQPIGAVCAAMKNNIFKIGENKIQEAEKKFKNFTKREQIELHFIGRLQKNKIKKAVKFFDVIETVSDINTAERINQKAKELNKKQKIFIQINISEDPNKQGIKKEKAISLSKEILSKKNLLLKGVMVILKQNLNTKETANQYKQTKTIQKQIARKIPTCTETSMGMSSDYNLALKAGSTQIRLGTKLFGKRK